ncbi:fluoride efflux transporter CrcB [candidate division KSB1 bacterium]|nr:fluoride efflux transporter CrcB [candidate division KSB1 bacterium]
MRELLWVGSGGFLGSVLRYYVGGCVQRGLPGSAFPMGTLAVNALGCLVIGLLAGLAESRFVLSAEARLFLLIGVLGGFTTYSSFGYETVALARDGQLLAAFGNIALQLVLGLGAVYLGLVASRFL